MVQITHIEHNGAQHVVELASGISLMEGATNNAVPGIMADCGGACACATCHVYVAPEWMDAVGPANELEEGMLTVVSYPQPGSRLACQISVNEKLNGLLVYLPEEQG